MSEIIYLLSFVGLIAWCVICHFYFKAKFWKWKAEKNKELLDLYIEILEDRRSSSCRPITTDEDALNSVKQLIKPIAN